MLAAPIHYYRIGHQQMNFYYLRTEDLTYNTFMYIVHLHMNVT